MAGVKGKSGGPRKNAGGARLGAGRKPKLPVTTDGAKLKSEDPVAWLTALMTDATQDIADRKDAAKALLTYKGKQLEAPGKKGAKAKAAGEVAAGRFAPAAPPRLKVVR